MLHKKLVFVFALVFAFISCENENDDQLTEDVSVTSKAAQTFDVQMMLKSGDEIVPISTTGLGGFFAYDYANEQYRYEDTPQGSDPDFAVFEGLSEGTYSFEAYDGHFDGASGKIVTIDENSIENENGYIVVTLEYWSE